MLSEWVSEYNSSTTSVILGFKVEDFDMVTKQEKNVAEKNFEKMLYKRKTWNKEKLGKTLHKRKTGKKLLKRNT